MATRVSSTSLNRHSDAGWEDLPARFIFQENENGLNSRSRSQRARHAPEAADGNPGAAESSPASDAFSRAPGACTDPGSTSARESACCAARTTGVMVD
jgi:hypothetical protein